MKLFLFLSLFFSVTTSLFAQDKPAYKLFTSNGKEVKWSKMVNDLQVSEMVFFGELHNNAIAHWLQYELFVELYNAHDSSLAVGAEMFESDNQLVLNEYLLGNIDEKQLQQEARLWKNFNTDYKPLVDFAKENKIPFVATNVPRRYASAEVTLLLWTR